MRQTIDERIEELVLEIRDNMFLKIAGEADVIIDDDTRHKYLDCNNRGTSKALADAITASIRATITPLVVMQMPYYKAPTSNTVSGLETGFQKYRFFINDTEVYTTGNLMSYRGDYDVLGIEFSMNIEDLVELTAKDFPIEGEIFESWKSGGLPINRVSKFTPTEGEGRVNELSYERTDYDRSKSEARYYITRKD